MVNYGDIIYNLLSKKYIDKDNEFYLDKKDVLYSRIMEAIIIILSKKM